MKKVIAIGLLIMSVPLLGALQQYAGKTFTPNVNVTPSYKFNAPTNYNTNYKFNQSITPAATYRNISFTQQQIGNYKPAITKQPNMEQARKLIEQATKPTASSDVMKKYATARTYSTSSAQQDNSWWGKLLAWLGWGTVALAVWNIDFKRVDDVTKQEIKDKKELTEKLKIALQQYISNSPALEEARQSLLDDIKSPHYSFLVDNTIHEVMQIINLHRLILVEPAIENEKINLNCLKKTVHDYQCNQLSSLLTSIELKKIGYGLPDIGPVINDIVTSSDYNFLKKKFFSSTTFNITDTQYVDLYLKSQEKINANSFYLQELNNIKNLIETQKNNQSTFDKIKERLVIEILLKSCNLNINGLTNYSNNFNSKSNLYWPKTIEERQRENYQK